MTEEMNETCKKIGEKLSKNKSKSKSDNPIARLFNFKKNMLI